MASHLTAHGLCKQLLLAFNDENTSLRQDFIHEVLNLWARYALLCSNLYSYLELVLLAEETGKWVVMVPGLDIHCWRCQMEMGWETEWGRPGDSSTECWPRHTRKEFKGGKRKVNNHPNLVDKLFFPHLTYLLFYFRGRRDLKQL